MTLALLANCRIRHALSCQPALILLSHLHRALLDLWQEPSLRHNIREAARRYIDKPSSALRGEDLRGGHSIYL